MRRIHILYFLVTLVCVFTAAPAQAAELKHVNKAMGQATEGVPYKPEKQFKAEGGTPPYTWKVSNGLLPLGMDLSKSGLLSETPYIGRYQPGTYEFVLQVTDASGKKATDSYRLKLRSSYMAQGKSNVPIWVWLLLMTPGPIAIFFVLRYAKRVKAREAAGRS